MELLTLLQTSNSGLGGMSGIIMIVLMIVIIYFFIIRPQSKQQKRIAEARAALKPGDKVMTAGGIYAILREINTNTNQAVIEVWEGVKMKVDLNQIYSIESIEKSEKK